jgi:hypothetical protein
MRRCEAQPPCISTTGKRRPRALEPRFRGGIIGGIGDPEPVAQRCIELIGWQRGASFNKGLAPALREECLGMRRQQAACERPITGLQREFNRRIVVSRIVQHRRKFGHRRRQILAFRGEAVPQVIAEEIVEVKHRLR